MFYEFYCKNCHTMHEVRRPMENRNDAFLCTQCNCLCLRHLTVPQINMNEMIAEGYRKTTEPPDELKPDKFHFDIDRNFGLISHPGSPAKRTGPERGRHGLDR